MDSGRVVLGIHDLIPVVAAAAGLAAIATAVRSEQSRSYGAAAGGAALIVAGGLSKASAKLIGAISGGTPPQLLDDALFPLLAPGMLLLAAAVFSVLRPGGPRRLRPTYSAMIPIAVWGIVGIVALLSNSTAATALLIGIATLGNIALAIALIRWARQLELGTAALLYGINLVIVIGLAGMARALEQTTASQWIEQNVNLVGQLAFLIASRSLLRSVTTSSGRRTPEHGFRSDVT